MSNTNLLPLLLSSAIVSFVCYKCFCKDDTIEHWWDLSVPLTTTTEVLGPDGFAKSGNDQENLTYDTNQIINSSFFDKKQVNDSFKEFKKQESLNEGFCSSCDSNNNEKGSGFYTVPGNYQPYLSPRMNSAGLNSYVRYQLPDEKYQANKPSDPFTIAEYFDKPTVKEGYDSKPEKLVDSVNVEGNALPQSGDMKNVGASKDPKDGFYVNTERLIFSTAKNRLRGQGDPIRGDLPVIPCNPEANPNSNVWFRPSANPQSMLNGGAMNVLGGTGNTTAMQLAQLMSNANGGQNSTYGGLAFTPPGTSVVGRVTNDMSQEGVKSSMNIGSQVTQTPQRTDGAPATVVASAFP